MSLPHAEPTETARGPNANGASKSLRVLIVEDSRDDAELIADNLRRAGFAVDWRRVEAEHEYLESLADEPDLILADYTLPQFDALRALRMLQERHLNIPLIIVTGSVGEERAVECMREGADDYLLKDRLARLGPAVERALDQRVLRGAKRQTERVLREREELFRELIHHAQDLILILDADGSVRYQSPSVERVLGFAPVERLGRTVFELVHPDDVQALRGSLDEGFRRPGTAQVAVARFRHRDGKYRVLESISSVRENNERKLQAIANVRDITDRRELEEQLRRAQKLEAVGRLAGGVAHDFNNLLTVIGGYAELLEDGMRQGTIDTACVEEIRRAQERGASLVRQLLTFARKEVVRPRQIELNQAVTQLHGFLERLIGADVAMVLRLSDGVGSVKMDPGQLEQVIVNLVVNARDAMAKGGQITIETTEEAMGAPTGLTFRTVPAGQWIRLSVKDDGVGMDEATQSQIFEPFFTTKPSGKGTGLGLSTVYGIVRQADGYITVESKPGAGATFNVYLPRDEVATDATAAAVRVTPVETGAETILIADDDEAIRHLIVKILQRSGYTILEARNGADALRVAMGSLGEIDLVITDLVMPEMSGVEFASRLLRERGDVKVLLISGYSDVELETGLFDSSQLLPKPFTPTALTHKVRELLDA